jgi:orotidine-5'-phosphate decarboxylase
MPEHFADRLCAAIKEKGTPACVGLDPVLSKLPKELRVDVESGHACWDMAAREAIRDFSSRVIGAVAPHVPAIKINSAFFEAHGSQGLSIYYDAVSDARAEGLIVIGDIKRGDVGHSSEAYVEAHLAGENPRRGPDEHPPDAVTLHSYLGLDGVNPFLRACMNEGRGAFALVQTSNESAAAIQDVRLASGDTVAMHVAQLVNQWAESPSLVGRSGYSALGAVVSPRDRENTEALRSILDRCIFLVPGYGAQGKSGEAVSACFKPDGTGAIVNASRSVIYAYDDPRYRDRKDESLFWWTCVEAACKDFVREVNAIVQLRTGG